MAWFSITRNLVPAGLVFALSVGSGASALRLPRLEWTEVVSPEGGFRVSFPLKPSFVSKDVETSAGRIKNNVFSLDEEYLSYSVSWMEFPKQFVRDLGPVRLLNGARESFFKRFKGTVIKERIVQLGVAPGRDVQFATEDGPKIRFVVYLRGEKLVQSLVISDPDMFEKEDAKRFFESFKWE